MPSAVTVRLSSRVRDALDQSAPVVALESSVLAQGLPIPANRRAEALMSEAIQRRGAVPAISAISRGQAVLGLDGEDLERFLCRHGIVKATSRDLGVVTARGQDGATTVAAALVIARAAGIEVFATGGIGGVHRSTPRMLAGGTQVRDESADLHELARSRLIVVCAGAKSILDLPATWERLETLGIPVLGFGTDELPGFFAAHTGIKLGVRCDTADEVARIATSHWAIGNRQAVLVVCPPPAALALNTEEVEQMIAEAMSELDAQGIEGPATTPFLLDTVSRLTNGRSLAVNLGLLEHNAEVAANIACAIGAR